MPKGGKQPGAGRPKGSVSKKTLEENLKVFELKEALRPHAQEIAGALVKKGKEGDITAIKEFFERLYGKVKNEVELSGTVQLAQLTEILRNELYDAKTDSPVIPQRPEPTPLLDSGTTGDIQPDSLPEAQEIAPDGTHALREELNSSTSSAVASGNLSGEVGNSGPERSKSEDNHGVLDPAHL